MKYKAFISYRHSENGRRHAVALETALKRYAKPTLARPMKIFRDEKHMKPDISLPKLIRDGLRDGNLKNLRELYLSDNQLVSLPIEAFKQLKNLRKLVLKDLDGSYPLPVSEVEALRQAMRWCEVVWEE